MKIVVMVTDSRWNIFSCPDSNGGFQPRPYNNYITTLDPLKVVFDPLRLGLDSGLCPCFDVHDT